MSMERRPLHKSTGGAAKHHIARIYLRREGDGERRDLFELQRVLGDGGSAVCYEALLTDERKMGRLKEFYPLGASYPFALTRTAGNHIVSTDRHQAFAHAVAEFLAPYRLLRDLMQQQEDLAGFIPDFSIYYPCDEQGTPIENGTVYIFTPTEPMLVFDQYLAEVHRAPTKTPEKHLYTILRAIQSLTECVRILHEQGLLHLDIKPANFGIPRRGERLLTDTISLFDVNSIQSLTARHITCHATKGFAAPEALQGTPSNRSDIYAIGCTLFSAIVVNKAVDSAQGYHASYYHQLTELVTGSALLSASESTSDLFLAWELIRILEKCLAPHEAQRYRNCGELLCDLTQVCNRLLLSHVPSPMSALPTRAALERRLDKKQGSGTYLSLLYHLYKHPLYQPNSDMLSVLIVGCGNLGQRFLDCTLQLAQDAGKPLYVRVLSADQMAGKRDKELYLMHRPALGDFFSIDGSNPSSRYGQIHFSHAEFIPGDRVQNRILASKLVASNPMPSYVLVALGDDMLNRSVAQAFTAATKGSRACQIHYVHTGTPVQKTDRAIPLNLGASCEGEHTFVALEKMALAAHICWKNALSAPLSKVKQEFRIPYYYLSSLSNVLSIKYKLHYLGISLDDPIQAARDLHDALSQKASAALGELVAAEHRRWVTEKLCDGWTALPADQLTSMHRDLRKKQHACLVESGTNLPLQHWTHAQWDSATEEMLATLDPLDRVSVRRHMLFAAMAKKVRQTVSPATMYPVLQLRALSDSSPACADSFSAWYTCLSLIWEGNTNQVKDYTTRASKLLTELSTVAPQVASTAEKLLALIDEQVSPILHSMDYTDYKGYDIALVKQIPFILTWRTDLHLAIPLQVGSRSAQFANVAAPAVCGAPKVTYLFHLEDAAQIPALRQALSFVADYQNAHTLATATHLLLTYTQDQALEQACATLEKDLPALGLRCRFLPCNAGTAATTLLTTLQRKRTYVLLEQNDTPLSALLRAAGGCHLFPSYRFDSSNRRFHSLQHCDMLAYLKPDAHLHASDLFPDLPATHPRILRTCAGKLWEHLYLPYSSAWRALCKLLHAHCARADMIASIPIHSEETPVQSCKLTLPTAAFSAAETILGKLCKAGLLPADTHMDRHTVATYAVCFSAPAETVSVLKHLLSDPQVLLQADALSLVEASDHIQIYLDRMEVDGLKLTQDAVSTEQLVLLLRALATDFALLTDLQIDETEETCSFSFSAKGVKDLLTAEERVLSLYISEICQRSGLFDEVSVGFGFDILITKGFSSLFLLIKAKDADAAPYLTKLAQLADKHGIHTTPVLLLCGKSDTFLPSDTGVSILQENAITEDIAQTLCHILTGTPPINP